MLARLLANDWEVRDIANLAGRSHRATLRAIRDAGLSPRRGPHGKLPQLEDADDWIRDQYLAGRTARDLAAELDVSYGTIRKRLLVMAVRRG